MHLVPREKLPQLSPDGMLTFDLFAIASIEIFVAIGARENFLRGGRAEIARKILLLKNRLMITYIPTYKMPKTGGL